MSAVASEIGKRIDAKKTERPSDGVKMMGGLLVAGAFVFLGASSVTAMVALGGDIIMFGGVFVLCIMAFLCYVGIMMAKDGTVPSFLKIETEDPTRTNSGRIVALTAMAMSTMVLYLLGGAIMEQSAYKGGGSTNRFLVGSSVIMLISASLMIPFMAYIGVYRDELTGKSIAACTELLKQQNMKFGAELNKREAQRASNVPRGRTSQRTSDVPPDI